MRIKITKTNSNTNYYVIKDYNINGKRTTKIIEKLGSEQELKNKIGNVDLNDYLDKYINALNGKDKDENRTISLNLSTSKSISDINSTFNAGYLFLQDIYYSLGINNICNKISNKYQFKYDLNDILSKLVYSRIIYPSSKFKTLESSKKFLEQPNFEYQDILRALDILSKESDFIQSEIYKNSLNYSKRNDKVLFYDCTNYYFEIEDEDDYRKYGKSKEHRPNPIVGMGLFMDGDGIPLTFSTFPGNTNEQITLKPLEEKIIKNFNNSKFIVCTDAGLASNINRKFNNINNRAFITTQSLKKLKSFIKDWSLDLSSGWKIPGNNKTFNISDLRSNENLINKYYNTIFYKERWIKENGIEQRLIITFSPKYQEYQKKIREKQINRAMDIIEKNPKKIKSNNENDPKRFIETISTTLDGDVALENHYLLDYKKINDEAKYDGLYAVCTNLEDSIEDIIKINKRRWEIEESFRIMKTEFKARPVYLSKKDRINAHFLTCFISLIIYRYLEKTLDEQYTVTEIIETLKNYNLKHFIGDGFIPLYNKTEIINKLHTKFNFNTAYEINSEKKIKKICKQTKN